MLEQIELIAAVAAAAGEPRSAARLLGAAEALEEARAIRAEQNTVVAREEAVASLRETLTESELREHWDQGRVLTLGAAAESAAELAGRLRSRS